MPEPQPPAVTSCVTEAKSAEQLTLGCLVLLAQLMELETEQQPLTYRIYEAVPPLVWITWAVLPQTV